MIDLLTLAPSEELGRRVSSRKASRQVRNGNAPISLFMRKGVLAGEYTRKLSVDRLHNDELPEVTAIAVDYDKGRGRNFYGWAAVSQDAASRDGRYPDPSPQTDNPYHADIVLPLTVASDKRAREKHASELAAVARWRGPALLQSA